MTDSDISTKKSLSTISGFSSEPSTPLTSSAGKGKSVLALLNSAFKEKDENKSSVTQKIPQDFTLPPNSSSAHKTIPTIPPQKPPLSSNSKSKETSFGTNDTSLMSISDFTGIPYRVVKNKRTMSSISAGGITNNDPNILLTPNYVSSLLIELAANPTFINRLTNDLSAASKKR